MVVAARRVLRALVVGAVAGRCTDAHTHNARQRQRKRQRQQHRHSTARHTGHTISDVGHPVLHATSIAPLQHYRLVAQCFCSDGRCHRHGD